MLVVLDTSRRVAKQFDVARVRWAQWERLPRALEARSSSSRKVSSSGTHADLFIIALSLGASSYCLWFSARGVCNWSASCIADAPRGYAES